MSKYPAKTKTGECIFCKIAQKDLKTPGLFWEDDKFMAFLSLYPNTLGVTVVIPKKHYSSDVLALPDDILCEFVLVAKKIAKVLLNYFDDVGRVGLVMEGTGINHAHIKLFPMHKTAHMKKGVWKQYASKFDKYFEKYEGFIASNDSKKADEQELKKLAKKLALLINSTS